MNRQLTYPVTVTFFVRAASKLDALMHMNEEASYLVHDCENEVMGWEPPAQTAVARGYKDETWQKDHEFSQAERVRDGMAGDIDRDMTAGEEEQL